MVEEVNQDKDSPLLFIEIFSAKKTKLSHQKLFHTEIFFVSLPNCCKHYFRTKIKFSNIWKKEKSN